MNTQGYRQLLEQKYVKVLLTVLIVVIVLIVAVSLLGGANNSSEVAQALDQKQTRLPNPNADANGVQQGQDWPTESLPETPAITAQDAKGVQDNQAKERVVINDEVVNQLMQRQPQPAKPQPAKPQPATRAQPVAKEKPAPAKPAPANTAAAKPKTSTHNNATTNLGSVTSLMQQSPARYTLQLMAGRNKKVLAALAKKHQLNPAWIYPRTINGQAWFVLVQGDYTNADQARAAINGLPSELKTAKPWPKSFAQAQKEAKS